MKFFVKATHLKFTECGWGNGYVLISPTHPMYEKDYDEINNHVDVHGGLTYSKKVTQELIDYWPELSNEDVDMWLVGFDTAHYQDTLERWPKEEVERETISLRDQLSALDIDTPFTAEELVKQINNDNT